MPSGQNENRAVSFEYVQNLVTALEDALAAANDSNVEVIWTNETVPPVAIGGFDTENPATPPEGLTFGQAMNKLLFPVIGPEVNGVISGSIKYKEPRPRFSISYSVTIKTAGATIDYVRIYWKRSTETDYRATPAYDGQLLTQTFNFDWDLVSATPNLTNDAFNIKIVAVDSQGGTTEFIGTVGVPLTIAMAAYQEPILTTSPSSTTPATHDTPGAAIVEVGSLNVNQNVTRYAKQLSDFVPITSATYYFRVDNVNQAEQPFVSGTPVIVNGFPGAKSVIGYVKIKDAERPSGVDRKFFEAALEYKQFYGAVAEFPTNSSTVRALPSNNFANASGNSFVINFNTTKVAIAVPASRSLTGALTSNNESILANFTVETIPVVDAGGVTVNYKLYKYSSAIPLALNVTITIGNA